MSSTENNSSPKTTSSAQSTSEDNHPIEHTIPSGQPVTLTTPIQYVKGVGERRAEIFEKLNIRRVADLIKHLPHRYEFQAAESPVNDLNVKSVGTVRGTVTQARYIGATGRFTPRRGKSRFTATLKDDKGQLIDLVWFNAPYLQSKISPSMQIMVTGKVGLYNDRRQMANPQWQEITDEQTPTIAADRMRPIYPATERLSSDRIEQILHPILPQMLPMIDDHLTDDFRKERILPELRRAYELIHQPTTEDDVAVGRRRLAYDDFLLLQMGFAVKKAHTQLDFKAPALRFSDEIDTHIRARFPFDLTEDQNTVVAEIAEGLQQETPMNRLLQGDVGSGKTIVALYALLMAVASNKQGAIMAPTELLAEQHFLAISDMLKDSNVRLTLLTGSQTTAERAVTRQYIENGDIDIVIGTQALLTDTIQFNDLAVVIIDEQHRFGVMQRATIRSKSQDESTTPHYLVMTATPIPRTLSLTVFGDLEVSTIRNLPPGRQPISTRVVGYDKWDEVYDYVAQRVAEGEQAYIVVPAVEESDRGLADVKSHMEKLKDSYFKDFNIATLHGRLKRDTRALRMNNFRRGKIDILIATTVIEVGVDVPNASIMIVEHADRFGLAQLHQLRGRVGRGTKKSACVFIADPKTEDALARMKAIARTNDGFEIAEADLEIRGMGELFGTRQSGLPSLPVARIPRDLDLLQLARRDAYNIVEEDPRLKEPEHQLLRARLFKLYGQVLGLGDVG